MTDIPWTDLEIGFSTLIGLLVLIDVALSYLRRGSAAAGGGSDE